ncbi:MAG TPA: DUF4382 domain-containing protein [Gemmatimonadales bacterium]|nr:DUF4382 domain-containing protein [Gemmatimonadales bacterium]
MTRLTRPTWLTTGALVLLVAAAACSKDASSGTGPGGIGGAASKAPVAFLVNATATSTATAGSPVAGILAKDNGPGGGEGDFGDGDGHHWHGWWGWMRTRDVDSLVVSVTKLEVFGDTDTENAADSLADSVSADSAHKANGGDDDDGPNGWEEHERGWITIAVDSAHLDLIHLPDSAAAGIKIATGKLPAGTYRHVRLFIINPTIYFDSTIVAPNGDTLKAHTGYPVTFPNADSTGATFRTDDPFTVAAVGDTVPLFFDRDDTVRHIIITGDGKIVVLPSFHQGHDRH